MSIDGLRHEVDIADVSPDRTEEAHVSDLLPELLGVCHRIQAAKASVASLELVLRKQGGPDVPKAGYDWYYQFRGGGGGVELVFFFWGVGWAGIDI